MTDKYKGVVELEILGQTCGFKFGIAAMCQLCELEKAPLKEVVERLDDTTNLRTQINFYFSAAVQYARLHKKEEPTWEEVANWIDSLLPEKKQEINELAFAQYEDPNLKAPVSPGQ